MAFFTLCSEAFCIISYCGLILYMISITISVFNSTKTCLKPSFCTCQAPRMIGSNESYEYPSHGICSLLHGKFTTAIICLMTLISYRQNEVYRQQHASIFGKRKRLKKRTSIRSTKKINFSSRDADFRKCQRHLIVNTAS